MRPPLVLTILFAVFTSCKEPPVAIPNTKTIVFNLIVPETKPIHALSFKITFDPQILSPDSVSGSTELFRDGHMEVVSKSSGLLSIILGQKGVHAPVFGTVELCRVKFKRLVEPSPALTMIEGVGTGIFYEDSGKRKLYSFRYKLAERLDNSNDANVTLEIE